MQVEEFSGEPADWDAFVRGQAGWTHVHRYGWREVLEGVHGIDCSYLAATDETGRLRGVLPLVRVQSAIFGHYLVSVPYLNYGGPLGSEEAVQALVNRSVALAREGSADLLELRSRRSLEVDLEVSHRKITVVLDLPEGEPELLWEALDSKVRSQVRRPRKEGIEMRFGPDQLGPFYQVFSEHMRDLGTPAQPRALFEAVAGQFPETVWFGCAYHRGNPVAGGCGLRWDDEVEMTWASDLMDYRRMAPNMLLYWSFMERAIEEGLSRFNFGRCTPGSGTHRFKSQWGTRDEKLWWYQHRNASNGVESTPSPDDSRWAWGPRLWRKLPLRVTNVLGPRIVRYIP